MASFDIKSLLTSIPLTEMLNLCEQNLHINQAEVSNLPISLFYSLLKITMFESFFIVDGKLYEQCDDVVMDSLLELTLANVFMCHFKNIWLETSLLISNQLFTDDSLMIHFCSFRKRMMLKSFKII